MIGRGKTGDTTFYYFIAVFVACYLSETAECYRRWKPLRTDVHEEADLTKPVGVYEGQILFGESLRGPESQLMNGPNQLSSNASVEDEADYQADMPDMEAFSFDPRLMNAWNRMTKSLHCGANHMDFNVIGSGSDHFGLNPFIRPLFPRGPSNCGINTWRRSHYLHMSIPYSGCNVLKEGGLYKLPLTWRGKPVVLSCQGPPTPPVPTGFPWPPFPPMIPPWLLPQAQEQPDPYSSVQMEVLPFGQ